MPPVNLCEADGVGFPAAADRPRRAIVYDRAVLMRLAAGNSDETLTVMIAHELGHFLDRTPSGSGDSAVRRSELAADEFAGLVARRLGLPLAAGARLLRVLAPATPQGPYPSRFERIAAFERGFSGVGPSTETPPVVVEDSAEDAEGESAEGERNASATAPAGGANAAASASPAAETPSFWERVMKFLREASDTIVAIATALGALYGGYRWLARRRRLRRLRGANDTV